MAIKFLLLLACLLFLSSLAAAHSSPFSFIKRLEGAHKGSKAEGILHLKKYLEKFGYLQYSTKSTHANDDDFDATLATAIKKYQKFFHLKETGTLDEHTVSQMMKPRCGVPDFRNTTDYMGSGNSLGLRTVTHYKFPGLKWPASKYQLRFKYVTPFPQNFATAYELAQSKWSRVSKFTFIKVASNAPADSTVGIYKGAHGDNAPFDGPYGVLAHAYYPTDGRLHFDGAENWANGAVPGKFDFETVAAHELGHQMGLDHSDVRAALMWPSADIGTTKPIGADDIAGIRALYGP